LQALGVRHHPLPGIGDLFEVDLEGGGALSVVQHRSGGRALMVRDGAACDAAVEVTQPEALALAALLTGTQIELTTSSHAS
jgi:K+/H+ antiporter YhaU regulatory subunit KhtT